MTLGIVVLNYLNYSCTIECVESVLRQRDVTTRIVVVDNGSSNDSAARLSDFCSGIPNVEFIANDENLGFARGNNVGIAALRRQGLDRILVLNSDIVLTDETLAGKLERLEIPDNVGIVGFRTENDEGRNSTPRNVTVRSGVTIFRDIYTTLGGFKNKYITSKPIVSTVRKAVTQHDDSPRILNPNSETLHGAALLFTENFFKDYDGFYPGTFLYYEEDCLSILCQKTGLREMYFPEYKVLHKERGSAKMAWRQDAEEVQHRRQIESRSIAQKLAKMPTEQVRQAFRFDR
ncbi:glycosyltransferase family 2 protein [Bifidobacterium sp. 82T24]|uniref:glycosyltransferase n=1 Tax=Bifidobacterium pluvialisilvae TaxID=2834436 RepID=UPI001C573C41|nr:glycosyltransferase family 2 protein [Bifidobacterium pluvialisilvae]MBW3087489.1 glycosyltransferase family 2 protein [Bifidobacterium pluvialisilvae]